jgi:hypothetical protein
VTPRGLAGVQQFVLPQTILVSTLKTLADIGRREVEGFVLWGGILEDERFRFTSGYVPRQRGLKTPDGLLVEVDGDALFEVNKAFNERGEILAAQAHSHPTEAYHSSTDDLYPIVTILGGLSLVIPDFARAGLDGFDAFRWYRLVAYNDWVEVDPAQQVILE